MSWQLALILAAGMIALANAARDLLAALHAIDVLLCDLQP